MNIFNIYIIFVLGWKFPCDFSFKINNISYNEQQYKLIITFFFIFFISIKIYSMSFLLSRTFDYLLNFKYCWDLLFFTASSSLFYTCKCAFRNRLFANGDFTGIGTYNRLFLSFSSIFLLLNSVIFAL